MTDSSKECLFLYTNTLCSLFLQNQVIRNQNVRAVLLKENGQKRVLSYLKTGSGLSKCKYLHYLYASPTKKKHCGMYLQTECSRIIMEIF